MHKALDRRHERSIKRFNKAQDIHEVRLLWDEALRSGDIPGAYWALLTHWATTDELIKLAFGDVHMLSHLVGAANRADIRRLAALEAGRAELALKVEKQQAQLREAIVTRDDTIRRLNDILAEQIAQQESRACPTTRLPEQADEITALRDLVAALQKRLATEVQRRERTEQRHEMVRATLAEANAALNTANKHVQQLRAELTAAEAQLSPTAGNTDAVSLPDLPLNLQQDLRSFPHPLQCWQCLRCTRQDEVPLESHPRQSAIKTFPLHDEIGHQTERNMVRLSALPGPWRVCSRPPVARLTGLEAQVAFEGPENLLHLPDIMPPKRGAFTNSTPSRGGGKDQT
jgi:hypothetical protein